MSFTIIFKYNQRKNQILGDIEGQRFQIQTKQEKFSSKNTYCISFEEIQNYFDQHDIISDKEDSIIYVKDNQKLELKNGDSIEIDISQANNYIIESNIVFYPSKLGIKKKIQQMEEFNMSLQQKILMLESDIKQLQKSQKESKIDVLFLIGMSKEQSNNVFCEKEIVKIQRILKEKKVGSTISIVKTKEMFKQMLTYNPKIIHVICHGIKEIVIEQGKREGKYNTFLEIEDQKGGKIKLTGQKLIGLIEKCHCYPELIILNSCHSQDIYEDMQRVYSDKIYNTLSVNGDFPINNVYAYKFIVIFYDLFLKQILLKQKIVWQDILQKTKEQVNLLQVRMQQECKFICCRSCQFTVYSKKFNYICKCFEKERKMTYSDFQNNADYKNFIKNIRKEEFDFLKQFVYLHNSGENGKLDENCYKSEDYQEEQINKFDYKKKVYLLLCSSYIRSFLNISTNSKEKVPLKYLINLFDKYVNQNKDLDKKKGLIFILVIKFMKYAFMQAERYILNSHSNSKQLSLSECQNREKLVTIHGTDFLTTPYPKLSKGSSYKEQFDQIQKKEQKLRIIKIQLGKIFFQQNKGIMLKYLQDKIVKSVNFSPQIHIFNLKNITNIQEFQDIYLINMNSIFKHIRKQNNDFHIFYFYNWCINTKADLQKFDFKKKKTEKALIYLETEIENRLESYIFYIQELHDKDKQALYEQSNRFGLDKESFDQANNYYTSFKSYVQSLNSIFFKLFEMQIIPDEPGNNNLISQLITIFKKYPLEKERKLIQYIGLEKVYSQTADLNLKKGELVQNINRSLLNFICQKEYVNNQPLYKYIYKQTMMNNLCPFQFIHKISLTRCLLKIIITQFREIFIEIDQIQLLDILSTSNNYGDTKKSLLRLSCIYKTFGFQHHIIKQEFKLLVRSIILNKTIPLNTELIKAYLIGLRFSKNSYKTFRDIIKIHKRIIPCKSKENSEQIQEIENLLNYLKVKYYFRNAKENPRYLNLYQISNSFNVSLEGAQTELSMILLSRIIIMMIDFIGNTEWKMDNLSKIINSNYKEFQKVMKKTFNKTRQNDDLVDKEKIQKKSLNQILILSTILSELVKQIMSKIIIPNQSKLTLEKSKSKENSVNYQNDDNDYYQQLQKCSKKLKFYIKYVRGLFNEINNDSKNYTDNQAHKNFCLTSYYKLELQIEECSFQPISKNTISIFEDQTSIYLSSDRIISIVNEFLQQEPTSISEKLCQKIENSLLSVQYYFRSSKMQLKEQINYSIELGKEIQSISNRAIFTTKLLTASNIQQISKILQKIKKIVIINEDNQFDDIQQYYPEINNIQKYSSQKQLNQQGPVELLIILNKKKQYSLEKSTFFNEKRLICYDVSKLDDFDSSQLQNLQDQFIRNLFQNILIYKEKTFSSAIFNSIDNIKGENQILIDKFKDSILFKLHNYQNMYFKNMQYKNNQGESNQISLQKVSQDEINVYFQQLSTQNLETSNGINSQLQDVFGKNDKIIPSQSKINIDQEQINAKDDFYIPENNLFQNEEQQSQQDDNNETRNQEIDKNNYNNDKEREDSSEEIYTSSQFQYFSQSKSKSKMIDKYQTIASRVLSNYDE